MSTSDPTVPLWRVLAVYRFVALTYAVALFVDTGDEYPRQAAGWVVLGGLAAWSVVVSDAYRRTRGTVTAWLVGDVLVSAAAVLSTRWVDEVARIDAGEQTLPTIYVASPVLAWAIARGWRGGLGAAVVIAVADLMERRAFPRDTVHNIVLLVLAGVVVGYAVDLFRRSQEALAQAQRVEAPTAERDRLAREIHDGVLQVLALVRRRGHEIGGDAGELAELAGEQEVALRSLVSAPMTQVTRDDVVDLRALLTPLVAAHVTLSAPGEPVRLPSRAGHELAAAAAAALDNVHRHAGDGARAWVLVEDDGSVVTVTIRDDGSGIPAGRLERARSEGRLGAAQSIEGRMVALGGTAHWESAPSQGTEVELVLPGAGADRPR